MKFKIGDKVKTKYGDGEVLYIDDNDDLIPYLVGINGYNGHSGDDFLTEEEIQKYVIDEGYEGQGYWFKENGLKLIVEENKMNKYVKMLMEDLKIKVGEKFDVEGWNNNPYHFDEEGLLRTSKGEKCRYAIVNLLYADNKTKKIEKLPILTKEQIGMLKGFKLLGYNYIARNVLGDLYMYDKMKRFDRTNWCNPPYYPNLRFTLKKYIFNTIKEGFAYTIDELLEANERRGK